MLEKSRKSGTTASRSELQWEFGAAIPETTDRMDENTAAGPRDDFSREVYCILGIPIDAVEMPVVLRRIEAAAAAGAPFVLSTPNLNFLVSSQTDLEFRETLLMSDLCPPDGAPIIWIARLLGIPVKKRVAGSDIFEALRSRPRPGSPLKIFLFGSTERVAAAACERLNSNPSGLECVGWACPGFGNVGELSQDRFIDQINSSNADFLVAALGARKGQLWLRRNHYRLQIPIRSHLGAVINFQAGTVTRAPHVLQKSGLEWLWRIKEEPALFWRYWYDGGALLRLLLTRVLPLAIAGQWAKRRNGQPRHDFVIVQTHTPTTVTLSIRGDATGSQVPRAIAFFRDAASAQKTVVLDLSQTGAMDARFLGLLLMLRKQLRSSGSSLQVIGVSPLLGRLFRLNGLEYLLSPSEGHHVNAVH
jgi:N-acetylglucosaminyldiphosphoundecaprenol N-acetyl-beta-D-mannosaminyltransferase